MTDIESRTPAPTGASAYSAVPSVDSATVKDADRWLMAGSLLVGTIILGPVGLLVIIVGFAKLKSAKATGSFVRPTAVTLFGIFSFVDACINGLGWSLDIWASGTRIIQWAFQGWGRFIDGGYYLDYNSLWAGGSAAAGEKSWIFFCCLGLFPARMAAAYGFLKLKRWGLRWMVMTSWAYFLLWLGYIVNMIVNFPGRFGSSLFGVTGWWLMDIWYMAPFLMLPWLYAVDKRRWCR